MPTYTTEKKCFIGDILREAGETFSVNDKISPLPEWLKSTELTPQQKAAATRARKESEKKAKEDADLIAIESNKKVKEASKVEEL